MNIMHPNEQELQRYLNKRTPELESRRIRRHLRSCPPCRRKLGALLEIEEQLDGLEMLVAPPDLSDRVLTELKREDRGDVPSLPNATRDFRAAPPEKTYWRKELLHGMIAMAATLMFISSGLVRRLVALDSDQLQEGVRYGAAVWLQTVQTVSHQLLS
ncbi:MULTISPECIES: anti-sigma factor [Paenibacillus]|uniref:anti-sigma factor n=1 Tax=Paenibacillus TaxID=44249 RepID=UPI0022B8EB77|nr:zf-HC2 domain-containing protein [Paenibacillus caseinilyticus]MCZ8523472.1 zf-HC2 domain-containing protein [Paenibacillus caseinilyticus]